jgi:hypothetical protein
VQCFHIPNEDTAQLKIFNLKKEVSKKMSSPLKQNTTTIQELLNTINNLPEAGGGSGEAA